jgi:hypothetical protein
VDACSNWSSFRKHMAMITISWLAFWGYTAVTALVHTILSMSDRGIALKQAFPDSRHCWRPRRLVSLRASCHHLPRKRRSCSFHFYQRRNLTRARLQSPVACYAVGVRVSFSTSQTRLPLTPSDGSLSCGHPCHILLVVAPSSSSQASCASERPLASPFLLISLHAWCVQT